MTWEGSLLLSVTQRPNAFSVPSFRQILGKETENFPSAELLGSGKLTDTSKFLPHSLNLFGNTDMKSCFQKGI